MKIIEGVAEMRRLSSSLRREDKTVVLVPTMGYLHAGHSELLRRGRALGDALVLSLFVNPAQFGPSEDFSAYPRDLPRDLKVAEENGVDAVFTPRAQDIYPQGYGTYVTVEGLSEKLCGQARPGHFMGVATVVLKLFNIVMPHKALFGRKDYQQLLVIKKMAEDLNLGIEIIGVDTVREADGLPLSSRNSYLSPKERKAASVIPLSLREAAEAFRGGLKDSRAIIDKVKKIIEKEPVCRVEYVKVTDPETLGDVESAVEGSLLSVAVRVGRARLIDNATL